MQTQPPIFSAPAQGEIARALAGRLRRRVDELSEKALSEYVSDTVYRERLRFEEDRPEEGELERLDRAARAVASGDRGAMTLAAEELVRSYSGEIHNRFSVPTYKSATTVLPKALTALVSATSPRKLATLDLDPGSRLQVNGPIEKLRALSQRATLLFTPTHLSNLDSPLIGYAIFDSDLPPVSYGAGLNLFSNPVMAFFMSRLGAYTVDRRKQGLLYKDTLKDYSVELLRRGFHSLFFPGGTRSRSGLIEKRLKKGLLGTGIQAWQENLAEGRRGGDVFVVPMTLSTSLVLEAETLVRDALAREGKARYIIVDDEFSQPRTVRRFFSRVLNLDAAVHLTFSEPMDLLGNRVDAEGRSIGPSGAVVDRGRYVCDAHGQVEPDEQRDRVYTERLADAIVDAFHRDQVALSTHVAASAAWALLAREHPHLDTFRLVRIDAHHRKLERRALLLEIERRLGAIRALEAAGRIRASLPEDAEALLERAISRFASFHTREAIAETRARADRRMMQLDPELVWYYQNRLVGYGLEEA
ncbi:MAG: 1-acyl-sn-glycerol-3-phosphate acyltransferase [Alphaproteobacteria bacterium]|nr:1-acyl-sn-glycerol-3-phosphate acyltransferase [Alphaproteobacteria bacterium]MCB9791668.1 1-acyl-sn-glycerol-3-phosphate acyltransferase [Alphaproteobacteria bacterium]MCB9798049.1 1-acyl-sn-glycerol-3-phosphate acyltransferase [Alphaproteobacteria bacterium]